MSNTTIAGGLATELSVSSLLSNSTCAGVDSGIERMFAMREYALSDANVSSSTVVPVLLLIASIGIAAVGARVVRPTALLTAAVGVFYACYTLLGSAQNLSCQARIVVSSVFGLVGGLAAATLIKVGFFFLGAVAVGSGVHMLFLAVPSPHTVGGTANMGGKSLLYWGGLVLGGVAGGIAVRYNTRPILEAFTAGIGGAGATFSSYAIYTDAEVPRWAFVVVGCGVAAGGLVFQRRTRKCNGTCKRSARRSEIEVSDARA